MRLLSPTNDFLQRSVRAIENVFDQLRYIAELRASERGYSHWGMEQEYGKEAASQAISEAHSQVWLDLMRRRIGDLESEARKQPQAEIASLRGAKVVPLNTAGVAPRHFDYLIDAVALLTESRSGRSAA